MKIKELKPIGKWWNDKSIDIFKIEGKNIALNGWNGERYYECWEVADNLIDIVNDVTYIVTPITEIDEDGNCQLINLEITEEINKKIVGR